MAADDAGRPGPKAAQRMTIDQAASGWRPRMPPGLPAHAKRLWRSVVPILAASGTLTELDTAGLVAMCLCYQTMCQAAAELDEAGGVAHVDNRGVARKRPEWQIFRESQASFRTWCAEFGMTPAARTTLPAAAAAEKPDLAALLRQAIAD